MRIVFIGIVEFSEKMLLRLIKAKAEIVGVITREQSNFNSDFCNLAPICIQHNIPYVYISDINSKETLKWIEDLKADIIFCMGWSNLIKKEVLEVTPGGVIGYHPTKLPFNRGRHPRIWPIVLGLDETASTFFFMDEGADSGDIISQAIIPIAYSDTARELYNKIICVAEQQIEEIYVSLKTGSCLRKPQNHALANYWRKRTKDDGLISFRMNSRTIYNLVRELTKPYVGAHLLFKGKEVKIWRVQEAPCNQPNIEYGKVIALENRSLSVKTPDGAIKIIEHEFQEMPNVGDYLQ